MRDVRTLLEPLEADVADAGARAGFGGVPLDVFGWDELVDGRVEVEARHGRKGGRVEVG